MNCTIPVTNSFSNCVRKFTMVHMDRTNSFKIVILNFCTSEIRICQLSNFLYSQTITFNEVSYCFSNSSKFVDGPLPSFGFVALGYIPMPAIVQTASESLNAIYMRILNMKNVGYMYHSR